MFKPVLRLALAAIVLSQPVQTVGQAAPPARINLPATISLVDRTVDELARVPGGLAGYSVIIAAEGQPDFIKTLGLANAATKRPVTPDTEFYIASMTKPYTGLMAARLHREGVLPLSTTIADIWPGIRLPAPLDPARISLDRLLSHQAGFRNDPLTDRAAYTDEVPWEAYPRLLETGTVPNGLAFEYTNLGYQIYAAALYQRTGRDWRSKLDELLLRPAGLTQTHSRSSLVAPEQIAWGHQWNGSEWLVVKPKNDNVMHPAGGMFASSRDLARFLRIQLADQVPGGGYTKADFAFTRRQLAEQDNNQFGIHCTGYALGWHNCRFGTEEVLYHGGTYEGVRTHMIILPRLRLGMGLLANSDTMTHALGMELLAMTISSLTSASDTETRATQMTTNFAARAPRLGAQRLTRAKASEADAQFGGWAWRPGAEQLDAYQGSYHSALWGTVEVRRRGDGLIASIGGVDRELRPATRDLFAARQSILEAWQPVQFKLGPSQGGATLHIDRHQFQRVEALSTDLVGRPQ